MKSKILLLFFITIVFSSCQNISQSTTLNSETKSIKNSELPSDVVSTGNETESKKYLKVDQILLTINCYP